MGKLHSSVMLAEGSSDPEKGPAPATMLNDTVKMEWDQHFAEQKGAVSSLSRTWSWFLGHFATPSAPSTASHHDHASSIRSSHSVDIQPELISSNPEHAALNLTTAPVQAVIVDRCARLSAASSVTSSRDDSEERSPSPSILLDAMDRPNPIPWARTSILPRFRATSRRLLLRAWRFFYMTEPYEDLERHFQNELWWQRKRMALIVSFWMVLNWALSLLFYKLNLPFVLIDEIFLYGVAVVLTIPLPFMVAFDWPKKRRSLYHAFLFFTVYSWSWYIILAMYLCNFFKPKALDLQCTKRDFLGIFYQALSLPILSLFCLGGSRFGALVGTFATFLLSTILLAPEKDTWIRQMINYLVFKLLIIWVHYEWELSDRKLHAMRESLKREFKTRNKLQLQEQKAFQSKQKFTSYVFHEVRVPLNSAILAVQNIEAANIDLHDVSDDFRCLQAVLRTMENVLNDMLDFNRLETGRVTPVSLPFKFHQVIKDMAGQLKLSARDRGVDLVTNLDPEIDRIARVAAYRVLNANPEVVEAHILAHPDIEGSVSGDETRLRQIVGNLVSNACKFTNPGGQVVIRTSLVGSSVKKIARQLSVRSTPGRNSPHLAELNADGEVLPPPLFDLEKQANGPEDSKLSKEDIFVRVEVSDTGCGIKPEDLHRGRLFSEFNQTQIGKTQGGKGTGLGLALVKNIVKMCDGRLGVTSHWGDGSCFWFELPFRVGAAALNLPLTEDGMIGSLQVNPDSRMPGNHLTDPISLPEAVDMHASVVAHSAVPTLEDLQMAALRALIDPTQPYSHHHAIGTPTSTSTQFHLAVEEPKASPTRPNFIPMPNNPLSGLHAVNVTSLEQLDFLIAKHDAEPLSTPPIASGLPVLVVEDDAINRNLLTQRLRKKYGCVVTTAENGVKGLEVLLNGRASASSTTTFTPQSETSNQAVLTEPLSTRPEDAFAVVFLDNQMPFKSGVELVRELRVDHHREDDFVVGVTGNATFEDQKEFQDAGANFVLTKPIQDKRVQVILSQASERWNSRHLSRNGTPSPQELRPQSGS